MPAAVSALNTPSASALPRKVSAGPPERFRSKVSGWSMSLFDWELDGRCESRFVPGAGTHGMYEFVVVVVVAGSATSLVAGGGAVPASLASASLCATARGARAARTRARPNPGVRRPKGAKWMESVERMADKSLRPKIKGGLNDKRAASERT